VFDLVRRTNAYVDERSPWHLAKAAGDDADSAALLDTTLHHLAGTVQGLAAMMSPFLPAATARIARAWHIGADELSRQGDSRQGDSRQGDGPPDLTGRRIEKPPTLFPRIG